MLMTEYETTMVMRPDLGGDAIESTLDRVREVVKAQGGKLLGIDHWGKRKMAFEIKKQVRGIYVHAHFLGQKGLVAELERNLRISDNILRYETIRMARDVDATAREEQAYVKPQYEAEVAEVEETPVLGLGVPDLSVVDEPEDDVVPAEDEAEASPQD